MTVAKLIQILKDLPDEMEIYLPLRTSGSHEADKLCTLFFGRLKKEEYPCSRRVFVYETSHLLGHFPHIKEKALFLSSNYFHETLADSVVYSDQSD